MSRNKINAMFPGYPDTSNLDTLAWPDDLARFADALKCPRNAEMGEFEKGARMATTAGHFSLGDSIGAPLATGAGSRKGS